MIAFKKVRKLKDGNYYPLFIDKRRPFVFGSWMESEYHPTKGFAPRSIASAQVGGWHCCPLPEAPWIADKLASGEERVWMKCEIHDFEKYERPQGTWLLARYIKPIEILTNDEINNYVKNERME